MKDSVQGRVLVEGSADGEVLWLAEPLSFWGGFDPACGEIVDVHHPQVGKLLKQKIVVMPGSRGSAGTPACIAETIRNGSGPRAFILGVADVNICVGVSVANRLYNYSIPVIEIAPTSLAQLENLCRLSISNNGKISFES